MHTTKFQILSDLHLEIDPSASSYHRFTIPARAPHLALLGDIGTIVTDDATTPQDPITGPLATFLRRQLTQFQTVFFVPGNHEPYHSRWDSVNLFFDRFQAGLASYRAECEQPGEELGEFVYLHKGRYDFEEEPITVLGCTLFSRIENSMFDRMKMGLNDFHLTTAWTPRQHAMAHAEHLAWLNERVGELEGSGRKVVVFTHHCPTVDERAVEPRHRGSVLQSGFLTDLSAERCWTSRDVRLWAFGHTHWNCDFVDGMGKRVVANQKGYDFEGRGSQGWDPEKVVEV
ncbi:Metallo-dependent phosphatase-like protein [Cercophora newfieldiana]|uniref:Metallo-dependent phosphatase-like protein n=1 Tax=Cercophora newfieldiana TaxID=92897 RepID=A0AA39Y1M4_9PEZI|nr:Metallo-dependent phosphatase-like protein [Cercophora newfieldiana]